MCWSKENEFVIAAAWSGLDSDHITEVRYYYWDGIQDTFNYWLPAPKMLPNALTSFKNRTISVMGRRGHIYMGTSPFQVAYVFPGVTPGKKLEINPAGVTEYNGKMVLGVASTTDDTSFIQGVYSYGNNTDSDPEVLTNDYSISTGTQTGTGMAIGMVKGVGKYLYFSWKDGASYGVDMVATDSTPNTSGAFESLVFDKGDPDMMGSALKVVLCFQALPSGATITPKYKLERGSWVLGTAFSTVGGKSCELQINVPFYEIEIGFNFTCGSTNLIVTAVKMYWNRLPDAR